MKFRFLIFAVLTLSLAITFQNCSQGFKSKTGHNSHSNNDGQDNSQNQQDDLNDGSDLDPQPTIWTGLFKALPEGQPLDGRALMVTGKSSTKVQVAIIFDPNSGPYSFHVHEASCADGGGGHYKIDPTVSETLESNEIWPKYHSVSSVALHRFEVTVDHVVREDARSIVVHDQSKRKVACADLSKDSPVLALASGSVNTTEGGSAFGFTVNGTTTLTQLTTGQTRLSVVASGLQQILKKTRDPITRELISVPVPYIGQLHNADCSEGDQAFFDTSPFKVGPSDFSLELLPNNKDFASQTVLIDGLAGSDFKSLAIWDPVVKTPIGCAKLMDGGGVMSFVAGLERGLLVEGSATMTRDPAGHSKILASLSGLRPETSHPAHLHELPCRLGGGAHYKNSVDVPEAAESNEVWLSFEANQDGQASVSANVQEILRPDAQSIVIHDPDDKAKIACVDL